MRRGSRLERLDGSERDTVGVDGVDAEFALPQSERGVEVLRRRSDVPNGGVLGLVVPFTHRHPGNPSQDVVASQVAEVLLEVGVRHDAPPASPAASVTPAVSAALV